MWAGFGLFSCDDGKFSDCGSASFFAFLGDFVERDSQTGDRSQQGEHDLAVEHVFARDGSQILDIAGRNCFAFQDAANDLHHIEFVSKGFDSLGRSHDVFFAVSDGDRTFEHLFDAGDASSLEAHGQTGCS